MTQDEMAQSKPEPTGFLPLKPVTFQILLALRQGDRHGYALVREIERRSDDVLRLQAGNLYRSLRTLLADGLIEESDRRPDPALDDERRRYFRLTTLGSQVARAEARRLARLVALARAENLLPPA